MRVIGCGSRTWEGPWARHKVDSVLTSLHRFLISVDEPLVLRTGACPTGADPLIAAWAMQRMDRQGLKGLKLERFPADWQRYGKAAGPRRNQHMLDEGADMCIGFLRANSTGTRHMMTISRHAGLLVIPVDWSQQEADLFKELFDEPQN